MHEKNRALFLNDILQYVEQSTAKHHLLGRPGQRYFGFEMARHISTKCEIVCSNLQVDFSATNREVDIRHGVASDFSFC